MRNGADTKSCARPVSLNILIDAENHADLVELAKLNKCSTANFVQHIIKSHLNSLYENIPAHDHDHSAA